MGCSKRSAPAGVILAIREHAGSHASGAQIESELIDLPGQGSDDDNGAGLKR
jgi:hypothetical protein